MQVDNQVYLGQGRLSQVRALQHSPFVVDWYTVHYDRWYCRYCHTPKRQSYRTSKH